MVDLRTNISKLLELNCRIHIVYICFDSSSGVVSIVQFFSARVCHDGGNGDAWISFDQCDEGHDDRVGDKTATGTRSKIGVGWK